MKQLSFLLWTIVFCVFVLPGATCQEYFVRKASRNYQASTHLLCQGPDGNKYKAAMKWNIPVVSQEWLFACAASGTLVPIDDYPVDKDIANSEGKNAASPSKNLGKAKTSMNEDVKSVQEEVAMEISDASSAVQPAPSHKVESASDASLDKPIGDNGSVQKRPVKRPSLYNRPFRPSFDLADVMEELASPACPSFRSRKSRGSRNSFPLDDFFAENIKHTLQKFGTVAPPRKDGENGHDDGHRTTDDEQQEGEV